MAYVKPQFEQTNGQPAVPHCLCLMQNVNVDKLTESLSQMRDKIGTEVFGPMSEWNRDYKKVQVRKIRSYGTRYCSGIYVLMIKMLLI